jgi:hypothetical protein
MHGYRAGDIRMIISPKLVAALLVAISQLTGYSIPGDPPRIRPMSRAQLAEEVCGKPCGIIAFTTPKGEILIDEALMIGRDPAATSILVHELTHFLQISSATDDVAMTCDRWTEREREAYDVQFRWLRAQAPNMRVFSLESARLAINPLLPYCAPYRPAEQDVTPQPAGG